MQGLRSFSDLMSTPSLSWNMCQSLGCSALLFSCRHLAVFNVNIAICSSHYKSRHARQVQGAVFL